MEFKMLHRDQQIVKLGVPNLNGRIYSKECMEGALKNLKENKLLVIPDESDYSNHRISLKNVIGVVRNLRIDGDEVKADVQMIKDFPEGFSFRPAGTGRVTEGRVEDYILTHFILTYDPA